MLLARDPFGIKPLYYADDGGTVRAASQVKALLRGDKAGRDPDPAGHVGFFLFGYVPEPHTLFRHIRALPAGSTLWIDEKGPGPAKRYFDVAQILGGDGDGPGAGAGAPQDLRAALLDSVQHHLVADVPVGVFLSAGLDSTTLTGLASESGAADLDTLTLGFEELKATPADEVPLAEEVARLYGTRHNTRWVVGRDFHEELPALLAAMDQPTIDGVNTYFVAREAARSGLKVALSGLGGDEMFAGYDSFRQIPGLVRLFGWPPGLRHVGRALRVVTAPLISRLTSPKYAGLLELGTRYGDAYLLRRGLFMPWELPGLLDADMVRDGWRDLAPLMRLEQGHAGIRGPRRKVAALEMAWYMRNQLLRDADWAGMAHSLEIRVPLVDEVLFRSLAPVLGRAGAPGKRAMARAPKTPLPAAVLNRPKTGFSVPVRQWLGGGGEDERGLRGWARRVYGGAMA